MEYNTTRGPLILPEYGRNVQNMIAHAMELTDRTERNLAAKAIIEVMGQLNPHLRDVETTATNFGRIYLWCPISSSM